jgi:hypothetical protein
MPLVELQSTSEKRTQMIVKLSNPGKVAFLPVIVFFSSAICHAKKTDFLKT